MNYWPFVSEICGILVKVCIPSLIRNAQYTQSLDASTNLMCTSVNGHSFSLAGSGDAGILMLPVERPAWNLVRSSVPTSLCYADREPEHTMLQSDSTETWRPGWCLLTNTHEQAVVGTQSAQHMTDLPQEKEHGVSLT